MSLKTTLRANLWGSHFSSYTTALGLQELVNKTIEDTKAGKPMNDNYLMALEIYTNELISELEQMTGLMAKECNPVKTVIEKLEE
ncbi:MAG: hypothetical protein Q4A55_00505 [Aerococcus sp.]|nr:hypothetical protein [Aerococcus sp.]